MKLFTNNWMAFAAVLLASGAMQATAAEEKKDSAPAKDYVACFTSWDKNMHTLQTDFVQTTEYDGILISRSEGRITYSQNGPKLRLDNVEKGKITQTALTDKKNIWIVDEKGLPVTEVKWKDWLAGQPNQALFDFGNYTALMARHNASVLEKKDGQVILRLEPKDPGQSYTLYVAVAESNCFPTYIAIESDLMKTTAELKNKKLNAALKDDVFKGMKK